jgi:hypothetical protein
MTPATRPPRPAQSSRQPLSASRASSVNLTAPRSSRSDATDSSRASDSAAVDKRITSAAPRLPVTFRGRAGRLRAAAQARQRAIPMARSCRTSCALAPVLGPVVEFGSTGPPVAGGKTKPVSRSARPGGVLTGRLHDVLPGRRCHWPRRPDPVQPVRHLRRLRTAGPAVTISNPRRCSASKRANMSTRAFGESSRKMISRLSADLPVAVRGPGKQADLVGGEGGLGVAGVAICSPLHETRFPGAGIARLRAYVQDGQPLVAAGAERSARGFSAWYAGWTPMAPRGSWNATARISRPGGHPRRAGRAVLRGHAQMTTRCDRRRSGPAPRPVCPAPFLAQIVSINSSSSLRHQSRSTMAPAAGG